MKITTYECDLCKERKDKSLLMAFYWVSAKIPQGYEIRPLSVSEECNKHICTHCINTIKNSNL